MKITPVRGLLCAGVLCALAVTVRSQHVELRATVNQAQEVPPSGSAATGTAIMHYYPASNTFDLIVSISGLSNAATASHVHEAAAGANGPVRSRNFGGDAAYVRNGTSLSQTFLNERYNGDPLELLKGNTYFNLHTAALPGGEVRGQLVPQPVRLYSHMTIAQEAAANPMFSFSGLNDFGGAVMIYNPATNQMSLRLSIFNFNNTFTNSHIHEGPAGVNGGVVVTLGNLTAASYSTANGYIAGSFDQAYLNPPPAVAADPIKLLTGGAYLNFHSNAFTGGELRGQVLMSTETASSRYLNLSVRGFVGTGEQQLIGGISITGTEPVRTLITAKGPSLAAAGVTDAVANPRLQLFDSGNRQIATNDDVGPVAAGSELARIPWIPTNSTESALVVVLPPGNYTAVVSAASGTGIALLEVYDLRIIGTITN